MEHHDNKPVYTIGIVAHLLEVCLATLRIWEHKGLIKPARLGKNRYYSRCDLGKLKFIKEMVQQKRINLAGVRELMLKKPCWEIKKCKPRERNKCAVYRNQNQEVAW
ncbi:MAG: MerR family transcriptional regulator [Candidatus Omnitrophica bacterium]|nr:MerR family transcriptional regulator [Candidatus Omnitrophota bacterium]